jgi:hypothetical protein
MQDWAKEQREVSIAHANQVFEEQDDEDEDGEDEDDEDEDEGEDEPDPGNSNSSVGMMRLLRQKAPHRRKTGLAKVRTAGAVRW